MAYDTTKNPFYSTEEDMSFSKTRSSASEPGGSNPWDEGSANSLSRYEQLQQMKENSMNNQLESTQRALASIYDSEATGVATSEELVRQGEQLDRTEKNLDKINQDMKTSQKHLNSIKSIFGGFKSWLSGDKKETQAPPERAQRETSARLQSAMEQSAASGQTKGPHPAFRIRSEDGRGFYEDDELDSQFLSSAKKYDQPDGRQQPPGGAGVSRGGPSSGQGQLFKSGHAAYDDQLDSNLDLMADGMSRLKGLAMGLGDEIEQQNDQIDRIQPKADRADIKLIDQNRQMRKILKS